MGKKSNESLNLLMGHVDGLDAQVLDVVLFSALGGILKDLPKSLSDNVVDALNLGFLRRLSDFRRGSGLDACSRTDNARSDLGVRHFGSDWRLVRHHACHEISALF